MAVPMYVETVSNRNSRPAVLLREGWREGGRVRKRTLANLTDWPAEKVQCLRRVLKGQRLVSPEEAFAIERSLPHGHVEAVLAMVVGRLLHPGSKLATTRRWHSTTLAQELDLGDADEDDPNTVNPWAPPLSVLIKPTPTQRRAARLIESFPVPGTSKN